MHVPRRAKTFKSGNSLALRLPKDLGLEAGAEFEIVKDDEGIRLHPVPRKIDLTGIAGSTPRSKLITRDEDDYDDLPREWHLLGLDGH